MRISGQMKDVPAAADRFDDGVAIADIADAYFDLVEGQMRQRRAGPLEDTDLFAGSDELANQMTADEAGAAGDEHVHPGILVPSAPSLLARQDFQTGRP